jgi:hypothetical protein
MSAERTLSLLTPRASLTGVVAYARYTLPLDKLKPNRTLRALLPQTAPLTKQQAWMVLNIRLEKVKILSPGSVDTEISQVVVGIAVRYR